MEISITNFKTFIQYAPEKTLKQLNNMIHEEHERRKQVLKYIDTNRLKAVIKKLYPFIFSKDRHNGKVAYRMAITCVLHEFTDTYANLNVSNLCEFIERDRTSTYHYLKLKKLLPLSGYDMNRVAYEDAKKDLVPLIKRGDFDLK